MSKYLFATVIINSLSSAFILKYLFSLVQKQFITEDETKIEWLTSRIKNLEAEVSELHEVIDNLEEKITILEETLEIKETEKIDLHQSNIDLSNKLDNFITYNYEVL
jgi:predicted nuclease with TOPRIM domain